MLMMMLMMKKKKGSLAVMALLLASVDCVMNPTKEHLSEISRRGEKYLDKQIENAVNGVKEMKNVMEKSSDDRNAFLEALEKTKIQKEDAMLKAQEMEAKLAEEERVCNDSMMALWEECKPCLKNTCVKYYSRTCSSGSGMVGHQLEDVLNRTHPFSIWINGEKIDTLEQEGQRQKKEFSELEEKYAEMADGVDSIFSDSMKVAGRADQGPSMFHIPLHPPYSRWGRSIRSLFREPFFNFQNLFPPMPSFGRNLFGSVDSMMDFDTGATPNEDGSVNEDVVITKPFGDGKITCREIRRNSAGCLRFRNECEKCKEIQHIDCSGKKPLEGPLKVELEDALALAERFTRQYDGLLRRFEERMANTSFILDLLNRQFGWVSSLANRTDGTDIFSVQTVICRDPDDSPTRSPGQPEDTEVTAKLFDSGPMNLTVSGDIPWSDPKFSEVVAQAALDRYMENAVTVK
ncbi:clusterin [Takifugu flavidus]|uniref:clusterin n=1 Tax=Takifugu flavidus TaxID=433684 RepID=UPI002544248F|nr:clusterin [Takifugu flavidus]